MTTRNLISIGNHPDIPNITRKAKVVSGDRNDEANTYALGVKVFHYLNEIPKTSLDNKTAIFLRASNNLMINPTSGAYVEKDEHGNYPEGSMGEYDYLWNIVNVLKTHTFEELEDMYLSMRNDKINQLLYT